MSEHCALVQPISAHAALADAERRAAERRPVTLEALSRPMDVQDALWWGATVRDISAKGIGLSLCYPFKAGTYLAVDLQIPKGTRGILLTRVVHARDQADGMWHVGCEFVKQLTDSELELLI
ncbi:MAG: PilZ domain-containing protein [Gemmataceae bacterium]|nr:PilZ domain-containing protein [Gemmataceae bacterium]